MAFRGTSMTRTPSSSQASSTALRWSARQRAQLPGARHRHKRDPARPPVTRDEGWGWIQKFNAISRPPIRYADAEAEALYAPRIATFADATSPTTLDPLTERLRAYLFHADGHALQIVPAAALYPFWLATAGVGFVLDLFGSPVIWAYGARDNRPWDLALPDAARAQLPTPMRWLSLYGSLGGYGPTLEPMRRLLFALDDAPWALALEQARAWLASRAPREDPVDDLCERAWAAWFFAREPSLAESLAHDALKGPAEIDRAWSLMLASVADLDVARTIVERHARQAYMHMAPDQWLCLVDTFGADAAPLLQHIDQEIARLPRNLRSGGKRVRDALKLAQSTAG